MKKGIVVCWLTVLFGGIGFIFWRNEWIYSLPTPVPENYIAVSTGKLINLPFTTPAGKPVFLHFFNPRCPCSKFNMAHFKSLVKQYSDQVDFQIVVMSNVTYTVKEIQDKFDILIPVRFDEGLADSCGVYSTPQAVILGNDHALYYRGNYNKSRYCSDKKTEYARMALDALLNNQTTPGFDRFALKAYGCSLPTCNKK
jgi:Iodothyronine deiodinase